MPELLLAFMALTAIFIFPAISGLFARNYGRSFWLWFFIGCFLPIISIIILFFIVDRPDTKA